MRKVHPWGQFLCARRNAIIWLSEEMNLSDIEISIALSMNEMQGYLIRTNTAFSDHYETITNKKEEV